jgi:hypothetical protein
VADAGGVTVTVAGGGATTSGGEFPVDDGEAVDGVTVALALRALDCALAARSRLGATPTALSCLGAAVA